MKHSFPSPRTYFGALSINNPVAEVLPGTRTECSPQRHGDAGKATKPKAGRPELTEMAEDTEDCPAVIEYFG
jgi:hypothetical protein